MTLLRPSNRRWLVSFAKLDPFLVLQECCWLPALKCFRKNFEDNFSLTGKPQKKLYRSLKNPLTVSTTSNISVEKWPVQSYVSSDAKINSFIHLGKRSGRLWFPKCKKHWQYLHRRSFFFTFFCSQRVFLVFPFVFSQPAKPATPIQKRMSGSFSTHWSLSF